MASLRFDYSDPAGEEYDVNFWIEIVGLGLDVGPD
jgi:hypothetical protein